MSARFELIQGGKTDYQPPDIQPPVILTLQEEVTLAAEGVARCNEVFEQRWGIPADRGPFKPITPADIFLRRVALRSVL